ncbi:MAG: hypothetical protein JKY48_15860 [Flavobacteriales bacterium]|nr:hypothetical protein [Flavobacteriales bacterium]
MAFEYAKLLPTQQSLKFILTLFVFQVLCFNLIQSKTPSIEEIQSNASELERELNAYSILFAKLSSDKEDSVLVLFDESISKIRKGAYKDTLQSKLLQARCNLALATWYSDQSNKESLKYYNTGLQHLLGVKGTKEEAAILNGLLSVCHQGGMKDSVTLVVEKATLNQESTNNAFTKAINLMTFASYSVIKGQTDTSRTLIEKAFDLFANENSIV